MTDRPDFPAYFLDIAKLIAKRGDCTRRQIGAVIVQADRIWATGYNGPSKSGEPGCLAGACPRGQKSFAEQPSYAQYNDCIAIHAEMNALIQFSFVRDLAEQYAGFVAGSLLASIPMPVMYSTDRPCDECASILSQNGILVKWE